MERCVSVESRLVELPALVWKACHAPFVVWVLFLLLEDLKRIRMVAGSFTWGTLSKCLFKMSLTCDYSIDNRKIIVYDNRKRKKKKTILQGKHVWELTMGFMEENQGCQIICTDFHIRWYSWCCEHGSASRLWAKQFAKVEFIPGKTEFRNNRTIQNHYQLCQQTFYYSSSSF